MTRRERLERKLEMRRQWAESRKAKAATEWNKGDLREEVSGIPLGQPILVGHHSEGRHRRVINRAHAAMERAHDHEVMASTHAAKARGLEHQLDGSIFSDDPDAVEALEAKIQMLEARRTQNNAVNKIVRRKPRAQRTPEKIAELIALGLTESTAEKLFVNKPGYGCGIPSYVNQNLGGRIKAARDRLEIVRAQRKNKEAAEASETGVTVHVNAYGSNVVTFAEKPSRDVLDALKAAGYRWGRGSWIGPKDALPECVIDMTAA